MAEKMEKLKLARSVCINKINEALDCAERAKTDAHYRDILSVMIEDIKLVHQEFYKGHNQIIGLIQTNADFDAQDAIRKQFDLNYYSVQAHNKKFCSVPVNPSGNSSQGSNIKLPKIALPVFDGNFKHWPTFFDLYKTLIHNNPSLSKVEKFQYLLTSLSNQPLALLKSLSVTDANYQTAYDTLVKRYQHKRMLATSYWNEISNASSLKSTSSRELRNLLDLFAENLAALKNLAFPIDQWDFIVFNLILSKLDSSTRTAFEVDYSTVDIPTYKNLIEFLDNRCHALETANFEKSNLNLKSSTSVSSGSSSARNSLFHRSKTQSPSSFVVHTSTSNIKDKCLLCNSSHLITQCPLFLAKSAQNRYTIAREHKLCLNCLKPFHSVGSCNSSYSCRVCRSRHHTLLHFDKESVSTETESKPSTNPGNISAQPSTSTPVNTLASTLCSRATVLLSTASVQVLDCRGKYQTVRILIDSASQASFISEKCVNRLGLRRSIFSAPIFGLNNMSSASAKGVTYCTIKPQDALEPVFSFNAIIIQKICSEMPATNISCSTLPSSFAAIKLADPHWNLPGSIDILLGAELFALILKSGRMFGLPGQPVALETCFGWLLMGKIEDCSPNNESNSIVSYCTLLDAQLGINIRKFWEIENVPCKPTISDDDVKCEQTFLESYSRDENGRFVIRLPFRQSEPDLGDTHAQALRRMSTLESRFDRNPELRLLYSEFMQDYVQQGHMSLIQGHSSESNLFYYLPHHAVLKPDSSTTKLRVVFDGSAKGPKGLSLNDTLLTGQKLQKDICSILLSFRFHAIAFIADIKQMYRQILVKESHRNFQRILWRFSKNDPMCSYRLNTLTYGLSSSPFLALRCIRQLAILEEKMHPLASQILLDYTYVDDIIAGSQNLQNALFLQSDLIQLLEKGCFELRKWASNHPALLINHSATGSQPSVGFDSEEPQFVKVLGLQWTPSLDIFSYSYNSFDRSCTKRNILSDIARIYDPLGFLAPVSILAKQIMQRLWSLNIGWDESPPPDIISVWSKFQAELPELSRIRIPRRITTHNVSRCEIHGFCDASQRSYAAVVYFRLESDDESVTVSLICAKSRVAPLKTISLPRLELCAATLLVDLIVSVQHSYSKLLSFEKIFTWSDSQVVLHWLASSPHRWKTFVANRVSHIQENLPTALWNYVPSLENPADCVSRGLTPCSLLSHDLYWKGPRWLYQNEHCWKFRHSSESLDAHTILLEERKQVLATLVENNPINQLLYRFSSLGKIKRIVAYCCRFIYNVKHNPNRTGEFSLPELHSALLVLVRYAQQDSFSNIFDQINRNALLPRPFRKLAPFIDREGLLRVGGRLHKSGLCYDVKHPLLLPKSHRLTELIVEDVHKQNLHPGFKTLDYLLHQQFWILSPRKSINQCISRCMRCLRLRPKSYTPQMGELPHFRISQLKAFSHVALDYAGPFCVSTGRFRGAKRYKAYICLFVCTATKAIHLELVSDLTSDAFLAAFRRFVARRGQCSDVYTDCGTNFVGANTQLIELSKFATESLHINWHFSPPSAPNFNGLAEAGVKSVKTHIFRVIGDQVLTFEELYTLLTQIEALLNSRPLCAQSTDPNDLSPLTPGHFLTLEPLNSLPDPNLSHLNENRLSRWQLLQKLHADFWEKWHKEYLHTLQQRSKWTKPQRSITLNTLVLIKNDIKSPLHWVMGRVVELHPGRDGIVRVVTLKTAHGLMRRPVSKLCPLAAQ